MNHRPFRDKILQLKKILLYLVFYDAQVDDKVFSFERLEKFPLVTFQQVLLTSNFLSLKVCKIQIYCNVLITK